MRHLDALRAAALVSLGITVACSEQAPTQPQPMAIVTTDEAQPLALSVQRLREAMQFVGAPFDGKTNAALDKALAANDEATLVRKVQEVLDPLCLFAVHINPEARVSVNGGPAPRVLQQHGWRAFLVKVHNQAGVTSELRVASPEAESVQDSTKAEAKRRWLVAKFYGGRPLTPLLAGIDLEYRILLLYGRDTGKRAAVLTLDAGQGTQDLGFRSDIMLFFECAPARVLTLGVRDSDGAPTHASFRIRDTAGRIHPARAKRLAPDFGFQPQIYRADGETVSLGPGTYTIIAGRGPEYHRVTQQVTIADQPVRVDFALKRWVDPAAHGWWSGDHHIHAAGCKHYSKPTKGVFPQDLLRHCAGEGLNVGCVLTWGTCMDFQQRFFTGDVHKASQPRTLLRYDIEVSGFGSHKSGHLCLLGLREQFYPGTNSTKGWPTLGLKILRWAKAQGAICGAAHSGSGLWLRNLQVPDYRVPPFDGIGAMEFIVDVTHEVPGPDGTPVPAVDFLGVCDTPVPAELNIWYHTLNCGFRPRISGESDFPCIYDSRVGVGRSYVALGAELSFEAWCRGLAAGRSYVSDGRTHLMDFAVADRAVGTAGSEVKLQQSGKVRVTAQVAALLAERANPRIARLGWVAKPYWSTERARIDGSRSITVEVIRNGVAVAEHQIVADGALREVSFDVEVERSSWIALRVLGAAHTNPVFVLVGGKPIRASKRSAAWCLASVDKCWEVKSKFLRGTDHDAAVKAYEHARQVYRRVLAETPVE